MKNEENLKNFGTIFELPISKKLRWWKFCNPLKILIIDPQLISFQYVLHNLYLQIEQMLMLAIQERLAQQLVSSAPLDMNRLWQSIFALGGSFPLLPSPLDLSSIPGTSTAAPTHPLYQHGLCAWPQCNQPCETFSIFLQHLNHAHSPDERSAQQYRTQIELVESLEHRLSKEKSRLQAMMQHLHMKHSPDTTQPGLGLPPQSSSQPSAMMKLESPVISPKSFTYPTSEPQTAAILMKSELVSGKN
jgi:hypothetical protein